VLLSFRVANHRSIRDEQELSLVATEFNDGSARPTSIRSESRPVSVVPALGIFGANASGKSNVLDALDFMRTAVVDSFADWGKGGSVPRDPFVLARAAREDEPATSFFEAELLLGEKPVRYTYGFEISDDRVEAEWLHAYPSGRRQIWFEREAAGSGDDGGEFRFPGSGLRTSKEQKAQYVAFTRPNALFLTVGAALNQPQLAEVHSWFRDSLKLVTVNKDPGLHTHKTRLRLQDEAVRKRIARLLSEADLGVSGVRIDPLTREVQLLHLAEDGTEVPLDFWRQESSGTHAWFAFLGPLLDVLDNGGVLLADELDASLHPSLVAEAVRLFQDEQINSRPAQLIFSTQAVSLLGPTVSERPLGRDQVWLTEKSAAGETELYPLTAARKARNDENLGRRYLHGDYGGVPRFTNGDIARDFSAFDRELRRSA
jgi:hypothetical protein